jgi:hypothetical protein
MNETTQNRFISFDERVGFFTCCRTIVSFGRKLNQNNIKQSFSSGIIDSTALNRLLGSKFQSFFYRMIARPFKNKFLPKYEIDCFCS